MPFVTYIRHEGHLTNGDPALFTCLNNANDIYCYCLRLPFVKNVNNVSTFDTALYTAISNCLAGLYWSLSTVPIEERNSEWTSGYYSPVIKEKIPEEIRDILPYYYFAKVFSYYPEEVLLELCQEPQWLQNPVYYNDYFISTRAMEALLGVKSWCIKRKQYSLEKMEYIIQEWVTHVKEEYDNVHPQIFKHYPWCYNPNDFKGDY